MTALLLVTLGSTLLAVVMTLIAWRASRAERRRTEARIASLAADIQEAAAGSRAVPAAGRPIRLVSSTSSDLFTTATPSTASSRSVVVVCVGLFVFATVAALGVVFSSGSRTTAPPRAAAPSASRPAPGRLGLNPVPLELIALGQQRKDDHLIVRGVIRNPVTSARIDRLIAVVFVFDADGGFVTSGRATIENTSVLPGGESAFLVDVPDAARAARYRVSFRTDTAVIPHLDKRHAL